MISWGTGIRRKQKRSGANKTNSQKNIYPHRTGSRGYVRKLDQWEKMEEDVTKSGVTPATSELIPRAKNYLYGRGVTLAPDGSLYFKSERELEVT